MSNGVDFKKMAIESRDLLNSALAREGALREELSKLADDCCEKVDDILDLQQRLTVAEQRVDLLEGLLKSGSSPTYAHCSAVMEALKPAAEGEGS